MGKFHDLSGELVFSFSYFFPSKGKIHADGATVRMFSVLVCTGFLSAGVFR